MLASLFTICENLESIMGWGFKLLGSTVTFNRDAACIADLDKLGLA